MSHRKGERLRSVIADFTQAERQFRQKRSGSWWTTSFGDMHCWAWDVVVGGLRGHHPHKNFIAAYRPDHKLSNNRPLFPDGQATETAELFLGENIAAGFDAACANQSRFKDHHRAVNVRWLKTPQEVEHATRYASREAEQGAFETIENRYRESTRPKSLEGGITLMQLAQLHHAGWPGAVPLLREAQEDLHKKRSYRESTRWRQTANSIEALDDEAQEITDDQDRTIGWIRGRDYQEHRAEFEAVEGAKLSEVLALISKLGIRLITV